MAEKIGIHCFVSGKVQGVWYRSSTQKQAEKLNITGWACNLPDGRVEVLACGDRERLALLFAWMKHGPELAEVTDITREEIPWQDYQGFETR